MSYRQAIALMSESVSRPTLYSVRLPFNPITGGGVDDFTNAYMQFYCKSTALPESRVETTTVLGHENMGVAREHATSILFGKPLQLEIIENSEFSVYKQFRNWFENVAQNSNPRRPGNRTQRLRYYKTYVSDMYMSKLELPENIKKVGFFDGDVVNAGYKEVLRFSFVNVFPIRMGEVTLDSSATDTYSTFTVDLSYETYSIGDEKGKIRRGEDFYRLRMNNRLATIVNETIQDKPNYNMSLLLETLSPSVIVPQPDKYYVFVYEAKTPGIMYDTNPFVVVTTLWKWGFIGFNFHWNEYRRYNWADVQTNLFEIHEDELTTMENFPIANFVYSS